MKLSQPILKFIAIITMLCDHYAYAFVEQSETLYLVLRGIGRISFPIFAFLLVEGYVHTSSKSKYAGRLFIFAIISEIPFNLLVAGNMSCPKYQNVMFELFLGLCSIAIYDYLQRNELKSIAIVSAVPICILSSKLSLDYGMMGIIVITCFFWFRDKPVLKCVSFISSQILYVALNIYKYNIDITNLQPHLLITLGLQAFAVFAIIPILLYDEQRNSQNHIMSRIMYFVYPVHMLIIGLFRLCN